MIDPVVKITRIFDTIPERVFNAWLDPAMLEKWMFGPGVRDEDILHLKLDRKPGGRFSFLVKREGDEIDHIGRYLEIDPPRRLVFTWRIAGSEISAVTIEIEGDDRGSELMLTHLLHENWIDHLERTRQDWTLMLDKLGEALRTNRPEE